MKGKKLTAEQIEFGEMLDKLKKFEPAAADDEKQKKREQLIKAELNELANELIGIRRQVEGLMAQFDDVETPQETHQNEAGQGDNEQLDKSATGVDLSIFSIKTPTKDTELYQVWCSGHEAFGMTLKESVTALLVDLEIEPTPETLELFWPQSTGRDDIIAILKSEKP